MHVGEIIKKIKVCLIDRKIYNSQSAEADNQEIKNKTLIKINKS
jgi:hypothetical protein